MTILVELFMNDYCSSYAKFKQLYLI